MAPNKRRTRKVTKTLLIISGIFGLLIIAGAIYFYALKDISPETSSENLSYCGCYFLDPLVSNSCGDSKLGFNFTLANAPNALDCDPQCSTDSLNISYLNSTTEQADYQICSLQNVSDERCTQITILNDGGQIVTGKVTRNDILKLTATFDDIYSKYTFYINNEPTDADSVSVDQKTIEKTINVADYSDSSSLEIKASGTDSSEETINSEACQRLVEIVDAGDISVNKLAFETSTDSDNVGYRFETALIDVGNLTNTDDIKVVFSFDRTSLSDLSMIDGLSSSLSSGRITIQEADLYLATNFESSKSFDILDDITGDLLVTVEVFQGTESLGSADTTIEIPIPDVTDTDTTDTDTTDTDTTDTTDTDTTATDETSSFSVTKSVSPSCVERVDGSDLAVFTITINNEQIISDDITSVLDKLPLGFTYVEDSTSINGQTASDDDYVNVATVGNSQEITWEAENGWSIPAESSMTVIFEALAGANTITGDNQNEVIVTPVTIPDDPSALRAEAVIQVAQDCTATDTTTPDTGILDISVVKVLIGFIIISTGYFIYNSNQGIVLAEAVTKTSSYKTVRRAGIRIFRPREFFETKIIEKIEKRKKKK